MLNPQFLPGMLILCLSAGLGCLPLTGWIVRAVSGLNLADVGTGNVGVAAAFKQAGKKAGILAAVAEIARGILPVGLAVAWRLDPPWQIGVLLPLVLARYQVQGGGGVTNATWGILVYSPAVWSSYLLTGGVIWGLIRDRRWAFRWGCISAPIWVWVWRQQGSETLAMLALALLLMAIHSRQADDMAALPSSLHYRRLNALTDRLDPAQVGEKAARLSQLLRSGFAVPPGWVLKPQDPIPPALADPALTWIVRSSALGEDQDSSSSAGQYLSLPNINTLSQLEAAIHSCRASYHSASARAYRQQRQLPPQDMAVLIQQQIMGLVSGVAFSRHPLDGSDCIVVEWLPGGAAAVVSGQVTPQHEEIPPNGSLPQQGMPAEVWQQLIDHIRRIEALFHGIPQDIEWTWDGSKLWILQSRPITTLRPIWTRTIAAEVIPGAIPPLTWSINQPLTCGVWGELFTLVLGQGVKHLDFTQTATQLGSHVYFNATLLGEIFRQMGLPEQGLEFLVRQQKMGKPPRSALLQLVKTLPGLNRLLWKEMQLTQSFRRDSDSRFQPALKKLTAVDPETLSPKEVEERILLILDLLKPATFYNIIGPIGLAIRKAIFRVPEECLDASNTPEIAFLQAVQSLAQAAPSGSDPQKLDALLARYGFLSEVGTDISIPCWRERPEALRQLIQTLQTTPPRRVNPRSPSSASGDKKATATWPVSLCQDRLDLNGEISTVYCQLLAHLRWTFLALEKHWIQTGVLANPGDIFFLKWPEIQTLIRSNSPREAARVDQLAPRRAQLEQDRQTSVPIVVYGSRLPGAKPVSGGEGTLTGIPASVGVVEGRVKILRSFASMPKAGERFILVVPYTDAGWSAVLATALGLVAEVGGQLSHGAIVARELGIPAVMNVAEVTRLLEDGQWIRIDGSAGTVERLDQRPP